jgi:hypothetical protein
MKERSAIVELGHYDKALAPKPSSGTRPRRSRLCCYGVEFNLGDRLVRSLVISTFQTS